MASLDQSKDGIVNEKIAEASPLTRLPEEGKQSFYPTMLDGFPIDQEATWIIPVVRSPKKAARLKFWDSRAEGYISQIRDLVKDTGIYAAASLTSPLITLLLSPFLTHHLSSSDYGAFAILNTFITLMTGVTQLGLNAAFFRAYRFDYEAQGDRLAVLSTFVTLLLSISFPIALIGVAAAPLLAIFLLHAPSLSNALRISAFVLLVQNLAVPGLSWLRAEARPVFFTVATISNLLINAGATVLLVGILRAGIEGALLATGSGYVLIVLCCTVPLVILRAGLRLRFTIAKEMLVFGVPHVLNLIAGWVLQLLDRYLLGLLASLAQVASYAVAYSLGGALSSLLIAPFSLAWWVIMYSIAKREDAKRVFQLIFRWFSLLLLFAVSGLSTFGVVVLDLFFPSSYHSAAAVIPVIALAIMFNGVAIVVSLGASLQRKTWLTTLSLASSAVINTIFNLILIPHYGAMGAAVATLIAYIANASISYVINQRIYPVPFEIARFLIALLLGIAFYTGSSFLAQAQQFYIAWAIRLVALCLYGGCLAFLGRLPTRSHKHRWTPVGGLIF